MRRMFGLDARAARVMWTALAFAAGLGGVYLLRHVILLLAFSVFFAYLIFPLVTLVQRLLPLGHNRTIAIAIVYTALLLALVSVGIAAGPVLTSELRNLAQKLPEMSKQLESGTLVDTVLERRGWEATHVRDIAAFLRSHAGGILSYVEEAATALIKWLAGAWTIFLIPVFAFFILKDAETLTRSVTSTMDTRRHRDLWQGIARDVHVLLGEYVRALILLALLTFVVWSAVFMFTGVPYALILAAIAGALEFLPVLGPLAAGGLVITVSVFSGYSHPWLLLLFVLVWRAIQDYVSSPLIMGRGVELHPALVIFGVIAGGEIGGAAGMFLSVPVIAALRIVWRRMQAMPAAQSDLFVGHAVEVTTPAASPAPAVSKLAVKP